MAGEPFVALSIDVAATGMLAAVQISWAPSIVMIIASLLACSTGKPTVEAADSITASPPATPEPATVEPTPATVEPEPAQPPPPSEPETSDECQIMLVLEADKGNLAGPVTLLARAKNLTANPLELTLADRCPGGEAHFSGLESQDGSYDYYHTCAMGACAGGRPPVVIALPPGELVNISSAQIDPTGKKPCNRPIATGTYNLSFSVSPAEGSNNPVVCGPEPLVLR